MTEKGRTWSDGDLDQRARLFLMEQPDQALGVGEDGVDVLDELVWRQSSVRGSEVHRAARGDDADAQLACGLDLRLDEALAAAGEDVVVVERRRAARERELGEARPRSGVLGVGVDARPDGVELAQPREEIGLLGSRACKRLVQVVVGVDEPRRDDCAVELDALVRLGLVAVAERDHDLAVHEHPARGMLHACVVARDDPPA